jgi:hypothetical protein
MVSKQIPAYYYSFHLKESSEVYRILDENINGQRESA